MRNHENQRTKAQMFETSDSVKKTYSATQASTIAGQFRAARLSRTALKDFPGPLPRALDESYAIQDAAIAHWPDQVIGWKVGRILGDMVAVHGTDRLIGPIFAASLQRADNEAELDFAAIADGFCAVEGEYVFELATDAEPGKTDYDASSALALVGELWTGIEVAGSPLATINDLGPTVVVSDFGNNWGLILGKPLQNWQARLEELICSVTINGDVVGTGIVTAFPGGITQSLVFALNCAASRGLPLKRGMLISTGAVSGVHDAKPGDHAIADFGPDGKIACHRLMVASGSGQG
ncbi:MAG: 2-keto-4-pentenoate hydratase [Alphaproteobacteria bacterium PA3]|nr:MAG: 2-keto-4-pentenoate hydratase [Alphaproteobacteria bacterium PA3]